MNQEGSVDFDRCRPMILPRRHDRSAETFRAVHLILPTIRQRPGGTPDSFPALNAALNGVSAVLILAGYAAVRRRWLRLHVGCMLSDFMVVRPKQAECLIGTPLEFPQVW